MSLLALLSTLSAAVALFTGGFVFSRDPRSPINRVFLLVALSAAYYSFVESGFRQADTLDAAARWFDAGFLWPLVFAFLMHYGFVATNRTRLLGSPMTYAAIYGPALAVSGLVATTDLVTGVPVEASWGWTYEVADPSPVYFIVGSWLVALIAAYLYLLLDHYFKESDYRAKQQVKFLFIGTSIPLGVWTVTELVLAPLDVFIPNVASPAYAVGLGVIGYAILRYQLFALTPQSAADEILSTTSDAVLLVNRQGRIVTANQAASDIAGYEADSLIGLPAEALFPARQDGNGLFNQEGIERLVRAGSIRAVEASLRTRYGGEVPLSLSMSVMRDKGAEDIGIVCIGRDLTDRKMAEEALRETSRLASIGELAAGVAHQINNPLHSIRGFAELLGDEDLPGSVREDIRRVYAQADRASKIVGNLLSFARTRDPVKQPIDLGAVVERALDLKNLHLHAGVLEVEVEVQKDLPLAMADEFQITEVLVNVLTNAEQAVAQSGGGRIGIKAMHMPHGLRITVTDDGPGIPAEHMGRIFDPFFTTKEDGSGTGLGLSVCYGIISQHGGKLWAESVPGQGTAFFIELPVLGPEETPEPGQSEAGGTGRRAKRVLVIDDEADILEIAARALTNAGHVVHVAQDGGEALRRVQSEDYDRIFLDLKMPSMGGRQIFQRIQGLDELLAERVVFMTGEALGTDVAEVLPEGDNPVLEKPFSREQLLRYVAGR